MDEVILTKFLKFWQTAKPNEKKKTYIYAVLNSASEEQIGQIAWFPAWRRYTFQTANNYIVLDKVCMQQIIEMIDRLEEERNNG